MRCERHGLAAGPEGRCVLCIREDDPTSVRVFDAPSAKARTSWLLAVLVLVSGAAGYVWMSSGPARVARASTASASAKVLNAEEVKRAVASTPITVYMTHTCPVCRKARDFMADNDIPYREKDVDENDGLRQQLIAINPEHTVPTFDIDGRIVVGFNAGQVIDSIAASVERRFGYKLETRTR